MSLAPMYRFLKICCSLALCALIALPPSAYSQSIIRDADEEPPPKPSYLLVPYAFSSQTFDVALGLAVAGNGYLNQEQMEVFGTIMGSSNESLLFALGMSNLQAPYFSRLYLSPFVMGGRYTRRRLYISANPDFPDQRAGSNESDAENFVIAQTWEYKVDLELRYLLPLGVGKDTPLVIYYVDDGELTGGATGGGDWDPAGHGATFLTVTPRLYDQAVGVDEQEGTFRTLNVKYALRYDNRDFWLNPTRGSLQEFSVTRDDGVLDDTDSWTVMELELRKYISFRETDWFRQRTLALNFWTAYTPTWKVEDNPDSGHATISHRPPYYEGATLGGLYRLRGFPDARFNDKSAIYYAAEYRLMPQWNPWPKLPVFNWFDINWWQIVGVFELGRVAPEWQLNTLHTDMKWDAGVGLRALMGKSVGRLDFVFSDEYFGVSVMSGQAF